VTDEVILGSFFSGIGAPEKALARLKIPYKVACYCEIDKYASKAYSLIHNVPESFNLWDITKADETKLPDFDLMTWGFPCQDISVAGKQKGVIKDETRSGLYYDGLRILKHKMPKYSIIENVKNLTSEKFMPVFNQILCDLDDAGYKSYHEVLNAKDYGIPQSRERIFIVSIRKDIDTGIFEFPEPLKPKLRLIDMLEKTVDEKYFLSDKEITYMNRETKDGRNHWDFKHHSDITDEYSRCLTANMMKGVPYNVLRIGSVDLNGHDLCKRIYSVYGCSPTIPTGQSGNTIPKIPVGEVARKFTPKECFRLMGFDDKDYWICKNAGISDSQLYKMAGNSIVVQVLEALLYNLLLDESKNKEYGEQMAFNF